MNKLDTTPKWILSIVKHIRYHQDHFVPHTYTNIHIYIHTHMHTTYFVNYAKLRIIRVSILLFRLQSLTLITIYYAYLFIKCKNKRILYKYIYIHLYTYIYSLWYLEIACSILFICEIRSLLLCSSGWPVTLCVYQYGRKLIAILQLLLLECWN